MGENELPIENLSKKEKEDLFNKAVEVRLEELKSMLSDLGTGEREIRIKRDKNTFRPIFELPHHYKFTRIEHYNTIRSAIGSDENDKYLQVKYIHNFKSNSREDDLKIIDYHDIEKLIKAYNYGNDYFLENQIMTEVYFRYYTYLIELENPAEESRMSNSEKKFDLSNPEKILLLMLLQKINEFPRFSAYVDDKAIINLMSELIGSNYEADKKSRATANKLINGQLSPGQKPTKLKSLEKILMIARSIQNKELEKLTSKLVENLKSPGTISS